MARKAGPIEFFHGVSDDAVVPIAGSKQGRLSWAELQPRIEPTRPVLPDPRGLFPPQ